ncbi:MAG: YggS family pyridoxal phosphate enzyme [Chloroflexi bacterium]|nr:MAG: YggS family pyridoxal phosphate enzyme [Chloroflexota bacterium]
MEANLRSVRLAITRSAERAGRDPGEVVLVAVTKTQRVERIREAIALGLTRLGENRVQEALPKIEEIGPADLDWHLIGHLQTNKVKFIEGRFRMVQSIDSVGLAEALDHRLESPLDVLRLHGLMTVAPMVNDGEQVRPVFRELRSLRDATSEQLGAPLPVLSMGMTDDYPIAIEEGATMLRLGRALFGPR